MSKFYAIPEELRNLSNWCLWKYEWPNGKDKKPTKVPYQPNGFKCDVTNPSNWVMFDDAFNTLQLGYHDGLGFIFTNTGYTGIDLDDASYLSNGEPNPNANKDYERQLNIFNAFDSYSEHSPSGKGLHIIVKGVLPQGRRRAFVEIYSSGRYFTMTGNVFSEKPIAERQELLLSLYNEMAAPAKISSYTGDEPETQNDAEIIAQCSSASNGDKFRQLYSGEWYSLYQSQSEADFAIIDIIAFYTQNRNQINRIFKQSALGKRDKAKRSDYVNSMIQRSFDRTPLPINTDDFREALEAKLKSRIDNANNHSNDISSAVSGNGSPSAFDADSLGSSPSTATSGSVAQRLEPAAHNGLVAGSSPATSTIQPPPGLLGELAQFIYHAAPRPVPEIALAAAVGLMAGVCGRAYNVSGTGLNQYILLLANTGTGKESVAEGIDKIINAVSMQIPVADEFIGPSRIASGQALYKYLSKKSQSFVSIVGEFGKRLEIMSSKNATSSEKNLLIEMLDLYHKSGHGRVAKPSIYSDQDKNTIAINSPAFSLLGESTPETFYNSLTEEMITDGLLPRFMLIEYNGKRPKLNENHSKIFPNEELITKMVILINHVKTISRAHNRIVVNVNFTDDAYRLQKRFNEETDNKMNEADKEIYRHLWNRAHLKALKIAALVAVGINYINPIIDVNCFNWAKNIVVNDIKSLAVKFESGTVGKNSEEVKQYQAFKKCLIEFVTSDWNKMKGYCNSTEQTMHSNKFIPRAFINNRIGKLAIFRNDRLGAANALNRTLTIALDDGLIVQVPRADLLKLGKTGKAFMLNSNVDL